MTTDRAFIAALQQTTATWPEANAATALPTTGTPSVDGPHFAASEPVRKKAPLSEHLARRRESQSVPAPTATAAPVQETPSLPLRPGVEVHGFEWPEAAIRLEADARQQLLNLLSAATQDAQGTSAPTVAFVGTHTGVGTTTALLGTAILIENVGGRVAILDTSRTGGAAASLGVRRSSHPTGRIDHSLIDDLLVTSRGGGTSVLAAGPLPDAAFATAALGRLAGTHDLVLIDADDATSAAAWLGNVTTLDLTVLLLDTAGGDLAKRQQAHQVLHAAGAAPKGVVETLAVRC